MFIKVVSDLHFDRPWAAKGNSKSGLWLPDYGNLNKDTVLCIVGDTAKGTWFYSDIGKQWLEEIKDKNFKTVIFTMGNNEFWDGGDFLKCEFEKSISNFKNLSDPSANIYMLENDVFDIENISIFGACLWGDYRGDDNLMREALLKEESNESFLHLNKQQLEESNFPVPHRLATENKKTQDLILNKSWGVGKNKIVLTHYPPIEDSVDLKSFLGDSVENLKYSKIHTNKFDDLIKKSNIDYWFYGHNHHRFRKKIGNTTVMSEPNDKSWLVPNYSTSKDNLFIDSKSMKIVSAYELNL